MAPNHTVAGPPWNKGRAVQSKRIAESESVNFAQGFYPTAWD
jgi:hypothetical protein